MAKRVTELKTKRKQQISALHRIGEFVNSVDVETVDQKKVFEIEGRSKSMSEIFNQFNEIQSEIEMRTDEGDEIRVEFENQYFSTYSNIQDILHKFKLGEIDSHPSKGQNASASRDSSFNVPSIGLPRFNGEYENWLQFRDTLLLVVDYHARLTNVQKFLHLRSCLEPEALDTIRAIPVCDENYERAWKKLRNRYGKIHSMTENHVKAILNFPCIRREYSRDLRNLHNCVDNNLSSLKALGAQVQHWDLILFPIISSKLDSITRREWNKKATAEREVTILDLLQLINNRADFLEVEEKEKANASLQAKSVSQSCPKPTNFPKSTNCLHVRTTAIHCKLCQGNHPIFKCDSFIELPVLERIQKVKQLGLCINCLKSSHMVQQCQSSKCRKCNKSHNTLLHKETEGKGVTHMGSQTGDSQIVVNTQAQYFKGSNFSEQVILPTAVVLVQDYRGEFHKCRALLDNGAMSNFVTSEICKKLNLKTNQVNCSITGVGHISQKKHFMTNLNFQSTKGAIFKAQCLVIDQITSNLPLYSFNSQDLQIPQNLTLADPDFMKSGPIDLLLGSSIFWGILQKERTAIPRTGLFLQETKLGYIVVGRSSPNLGNFDSNTLTINCLSTLNDPLSEQLKGFWELEEVDNKHSLSPDDQMCEDLFTTTHERSSDGKFIVKIPFKQNLNLLGHSREFAIKRFQNLVKKLTKNKKLHSDYSKIMNEYISMGHMTPVNDKIENCEQLNYYIPHHAVIREESLTTKTRIVFDASMRTISGLSLNDVQHIGPTIQNHLFSMVVNFRLHKYVICSDISKMYRMVWLHNEHKPFHRIFWREQPTDILKCYELQTVTFGTASAPYLAIRCLHQLADENSRKYPKSCNIIKNNFYVDDLIYGTESIQDLLQVQHEVTSILASAGFYLRKWLCKNDEIYSQLQVNPNLELNTLQFGDKTSKILGITWDSKTDEILYKCVHLHDNPIITKRIVLSDLAKIFDPLGLLGPVIIVGKILIQNLWKLDIGWDDQIPRELSDQWCSFRHEILQLPQTRIKRKVLIDNFTTAELHGFCDASERAYGACLFIKSKNCAADISIHLLCSKSRLAPIKQVSLPRLELCGALLLARLADKVISKLEISFENVYFWTDSTIVLSWLRSDPQRWKTFVANRVGEIQTLTKIKNWNHVKSQDNPCHILSRGATASQLADHRLWWSGPTWLIQETFLKASEPELNDIPEQRILFSSLIANQTLEIVERYSNLQRVIRITAYCFRFKFNCKFPIKQRRKGELSVEELQSALKILLKLMQQGSFPQEYQKLQFKKQLHPKSRLLPLNPFLDYNGIIRVGGRLTKSDLNLETKHPIVLDPKHRLSKLLAKQIHFENFHCGPSMLLAFLRQKYWPLAGRNFVRGITRTCIVCFHARPKSSSYIMGDLPKSRLSPSFPFENVGIDYAGPLLLKDRMTRNYKTVKCYICLFICLTTKAMHLELVADLTTERFFASLNRFISRRGRPKNIYSDNGTNFVGANAEIRRVYEFLQTNNHKIYQFSANNNIEWHFIPARTSNFGGLWEANIKRVKYHLITTMKNNKFSYEELCTVLCQIESVLNSRPLTPLSNDPTDVTPLTPAHFLIGRSFLSSPETSAVIPTSKLKHFQHLQSCIQHFWKRWSLEYMTSLQVRGKWRTTSNQSPIQVGKVVLVKDEGHPPFQWPLGRVTEVHPGSDGVIRVVTVKVGDSIAKRGVSKICPLPEDL